LNYTVGATSAIQTQLNAKQTLDATLTALAAYNTAGLITQTAADTFTGRTLTGTADQIVVTNGSGVAGNPTLALAFTPVQQNGGTGMASNKIYVGWGSAVGSGLLAQVDSTPIGAIVRKVDSFIWQGDLVSPGTAPLFACRAWVNFNGTGTVAIRASGNVTSITDNGVGDYTVNFTTAMPDVNYAVVGSQKVANTTATANQGATVTPFNLATGSVRLHCNDNGTLRDTENTFVAIHR